MDNEHMDKECMACSCPCDTHKEHTHMMSDEDGGKTCSDCGHEHNADGTCPQCECKM